MQYNVIAFVDLSLAKELSGFKTIPQTISLIGQKFRVAIGQWENSGQRSHIKNSLVQKNHKNSQLMSGRYLKYFLIEIMKLI